MTRIQLEPPCVHCGEPAGEWSVRTRLSAVAARAIGIRDGIPRLLDYPVCSWCNNEVMDGDIDCDDEAVAVLTRTGSVPEGWSVRVNLGGHHHLDDLWLPNNDG